MIPLEDWNLIIKVSSSLSCVSLFIFNIVLVLFSLIVNESLLLLIINLFNLSNKEIHCWIMSLSLLSLIIISFLNICTSNFIKSSCLFIFIKNPDLLIVCNLFLSDLIAFSSRVIMLLTGRGRDCIGAFHAKPGP